MKTFSITDVGMVRQVNQDYVFTTGKPLGILQNLFVVADGMGGHQAGDYASKCTCLLFLYDKIFTRCECNTLLIILMSVKYITVIFIPP